MTQLDPVQSATIQTWPAGVLDCLDAMALPLERRGFEPVTPWWQGVLEKFYGGEQRTLVCRVGRRGRKSSTLCRVAVAEILSARHKIPPGDTGVVAIVSVDVREATERIATIAAILEALSIEFKKTAKGIEFHDRPYRISVFTASISGVSGFTCICAIGDEVAKWREGDTKVNPAAQVLASWRPTMLTQPLAKMFLLSSPMGLDDAHAEAYSRGNTNAQQTAHASTWIASPTLTEQACRDLSASEMEFQREYAAVPQVGSDEGGITTEQIDRATRRTNLDPHEQGLFKVAAFNACPRSRKWGVMVVARRRGVGGKVRAAVLAARSWPASWPPDKAVEQVRELLKVNGVEFAWIPRDAPSFAKPYAARMGMVLVAADVPADLHESLRLRFAADDVEIPDDPELREDLLQARKRLGLTGYTYETRGYATLLALAADRAKVEPTSAPIAPDYSKPGYYSSQAYAEKHAKKMQEIMAKEIADDDRRAREAQDNRSEHDWIADIRRGFQGPIDPEDDPN